MYGFWDLFREQWPFSLTHAYQDTFSPKCSQYTLNSLLMSTTHGIFFGIKDLCSNSVKAVLFTILCYHDLCKFSLWYTVHPMNYELCCILLRFGTNNIAGIYQATSLTLYKYRLNGLIYNHNKTQHSAAYFFWKCTMHNYLTSPFAHKINGLMQNRCNSSALALELHLFCIKPSTSNNLWYTSCLIPTESECFCNYSNNSVWVKGKDAVGSMALSALDWAIYCWANESLSRLDNWAAKRVAISKTA